MKIENIKFKAKRLDNNTWVEGYFYAECGNTYIIEDRQSESMLNRNEAHQVDPLTVCQFIGLKDCEGIEVWEGDILEGSHKGEICFYQGAFVIHSIGDDTFSSLFNYTTWDGKITCKVIGNEFDKKK